jgi:hypothetical protein
MPDYLFDWYREIPDGYDQVKYFGTKHLRHIHPRAWDVLAANGAQLRVNALFDPIQQKWWFYLAAPNRIAYWHEH